MARIVLSSYLRRTGDIISYWCPGCNKAHDLNTDGQAPSWSWNGDAERPTFNPSVLVTQDDAVCHAWIRDGEAEFLSDTTHALAGQRVRLPRFGRSE